MKIYIVTLKVGPDSFDKELVYATDRDAAMETAEMKFNCKCINAYRASCHVRVGA